MRLPAHFGHWLLVNRRGRKVLRWQVAAGLIYGQVKKCYRRRKLVRVTQVMRLGTQTDLTVALQGMGFSGRLNTAFIERVNLTVRHGIAALARRTWATAKPAPTPVSTPGVVACLLSFRASSPIPTSSARAPVRTRGQTSGTTLSTANSGYGCWQNQSTMDGARGAFLPIATGFRLRASESRGGLQCHVTGRLVHVPAEVVGWGLTPGREGLSGLPNDEKPARNGFGEAGGIVHHLLWLHPPLRVS
jgi:IS1 family transposase